MSLVPCCATLSLSLSLAHVGCPFLKSVWMFVLLFATTEHLIHLVFTLSCSFDSDYFWLGLVRKCMRFELVMRCVLDLCVYVYCKCIHVYWQCIYMKFVSLIWWRNQKLAIILLSTVALFLWCCLLIFYVFFLCSVFVAVAVVIHISVQSAHWECGGYVCGCDATQIAMKALTLSLHS